ncbi:MAG: hypothetical protein HYY93_08305 [Planctomycetes bacterium]|nr:hypothetical protein [Planctomycetota bacterium]
MQPAKRSRDEMRPEYDFSNARPNRFAKRFARGRAGGVLVLLEPDVAKAFKSSEKLNAFLRATLAAVKG